MNELVLSHFSALPIIRQYRINQNACDINFVKQFQSHANHMQKIEVLVPNKNRIYKSENYKFHILSEKILDRQIVHINNVICVSAELLIIQLANSLSFESLCNIIMEMCGTYTYDYETAKFVNVEFPISSLQSFKQATKFFNATTNTIHGLCKTEYALKYCADNSASPMETKLYIMLCGPRKFGFYGCKNMAMNVDVELGAKAQSIAGQKIVRPDIVCVPKKVAIEYDSAQYHESTIQGQRDKRRRDALVNDG